MTLGAPMLSRLKSSLEKRAPGVVGALRGLRGQPEPASAAPVHHAPVRTDSRPVAAAPVAARVEPVVARPVPSRPAPVVAAPVVEPAAKVAAAAAVAARVEPAAEPVAKAAAGAAPVVALAKPAAARVEPVAPKAEPVAKVAAKVEAKPAAKAEVKPDKTKNQAADTGSTDIGAYIARAKANGRDPGLIKGSEGINVADDGVEYEGPLDNESSREKAAKKLLVIDQFECISCGTCVEQTEKVFYLPIDGKATPIAQEGPMDLIQDAIEACPVTCIHWVTPAEAVERNLTSGVEG